MDLTNALHRLRHRKLALLLAALLGVVAFVLLTFQVSGSGLQRKSTSSGTAQSELLVDSRRSSLIRVSNLNGELADRAILIAQFAQSPSIQKRMAEALDRPRDSFRLASSTSTLTSPGGGSAGGGDTSQAPLPAAGTPSVVFRASGGLPVVRITASASTAGEAQQLASAARKALIETIQKVGSNPKTDTSSSSSSSSSKTTQPDDKSYPLLLRPVADTDGSTVTTVSSLGKGVGAGVGVFVVLGLLSLAIGRPRRDGDHEGGTPAPTVDGEAAALRAYEAFRRNGHDRELVAAGPARNGATEDQDRDDA